MTKRSLTTAPLLLLAIAACGDKDPSGGNVPKNITDVVVDPPVPVVAPGATVQLSATVVDDDDKLRYGVDASWRALDPGVASVSGRGLLKGESVGKARIVATVGSKADTATVFVSSTPLLGINANAAPNPGDDACGPVTPVGARVAATSQRATILHDIDNPAGGFTDAEYQAFANAFDQIVWPSNVENFGEPTDIDRSGRVNILFSRRVNELTPRGVNYLVGGFFFARDLFPRRGSSSLGGCPSSNEGEIFYLLAPDPSGTINGNTRTKDYVRNSSLGTLAHEFQHLINSGRRLHVNKVPGNDPFEVLWLDEGLAHIAEELAFYRAAGLTPGMDLTVADVRSTSQRLRAFAEYGDQNFGRLEEYYTGAPTGGPSVDTPLSTDERRDDDLRTRGAIWQFLRYAADRRGGNQRDFWFGLVNTQTRGVDNLNAQLGGNMLSWLRDWGISIYADNTVPGIGAPYNQPSWNYRDVLSSSWYSSTGQSPLETRTLANGVQLPLTIRGGSSAHVRFGVAPGARAELRTTSGGGTVDGSCSVNGSTPTLAVGQVFTGDPSNASVLCLDGGATGAEFVYIPFFSTTVGSSTLAVEVTGTGIVPVIALNPAWMPGAAIPAPLAQLRAATTAGDGGMELRLRRRERAELSRLVRDQGTTPRFQSAAAPAPATLRISVLRTR